MTRALRRRGIRVAEFLATTLPIPNPYFNLRNHRKILIVDGSRAFTGGMNIREGCLARLEPPPRSPVRDLHFEITGPVVAQIFEAGAFDWDFATGESLDGPAWATSLPSPPARSRRASSRWAPTRISRRSASCSTARWRRRAVASAW